MFFCCSTLSFLQHSSSDRSLRRKCLLLQIQLLQLVTPVSPSIQT
ncbi:hypothetical protein DNTS_033543 [Danionella cerebrum]|uniref:Uncharacterized protein n=1 Tax=Danionella cerebrum TaxID=2873325 RepID=A0A553N1J9_9TELE|nr:hypothetical protein DNTS_033543 [Danionella translucida]